LTAPNVLGSVAELARAAGVNRVTVYKWQGEVPLLYRRQVVDYCRSRGVYIPSTAFAVLIDAEG
jgi:hypothetical protein